jgi:hypothetical protein
MYVWWLKYVHNGDVMVVLCFSNLIMELIGGREEREPKLDQTSPTPHPPYLSPSLPPSLSLSLSLSLPPLSLSFSLSL